MHRSGWLAGSATRAPPARPHSLSNERFDFERFHAPEEIGEVCVKGDHEAMYWNCPVHIPARRESPVFVEQMGGYDPFAVGGRYHG
jgi:hypothetical protein